ncbi:MAG: helix-turn-helix domain-containing protein [Sedimenticola sp.]
MLIVSPDDLGSYCREQRKLDNVTQEKLAEAINMRQGTISSLETNPSSAKVDTLFRVLAELGLEMHLVPKSRAPDSNSDRWTERW